MAVLEGRVSDFFFASVYLARRARGLVYTSGVSLHETTGRGTVIDIEDLEKHL